MKKVFYITLFSLVLSPSVFAYIDPGTGSYIVQVIFAIIIGIGFKIKSIFTYLKGLFFSDKNENKNDE